MIVNTHENVDNITFVKLNINVIISYYHYAQSQHEVLIPDLMCNFLIIFIIMSYYKVKQYFHTITSTFTHISIIYTIPMKKSILYF